MTTTLLGIVVALGLAAAPQPSPVSPQHVVANTPARSRQVTVQVQDDNFSDVDVYARSQGLTWRLGTVVAMQTREFTLPQGMVSPDASVRLIFAPLDGWRYWISPPVLVSPGDHLVSEDLARDRTTIGPWGGGASCSVAPFRLPLPPFGARLRLSTGVPHRPLASVRPT